MAKTKKAAGDGLHEDVLASMTQMQKAANRLNLSTLQPSSGRAGAAMAAAKGGEVCRIYNKIKPVLTLVVGFPLLPAKIRNAVKLLMGALDVMCPVK